MPKSRRLTSHNRHTSQTYCPQCLHWKWILFFSLIFGLVFAFIAQWPSMNKSGYFYPTAQQLSSIVATYRGTQPCADCPGIEVILTLNSDNTYVQKSVYLERNSANEEKGTWTVVTGTPKDKQAQVLQLVSTGNGTKSFFLIAGGRLTPLDADRNPLPAPYNTSLQRQ